MSASRCGELIELFLVKSLDQFLAILYASPGARGIGECSMLVIELHMFNEYAIKPVKSTGILWRAWQGMTKFHHQSGTNNNFYSIEGTSFSGIFGD